MKKSIQIKNDLKKQKIKLRNLYELRFKKNIRVYHKYT